MKKVLFFAIALVASALVFVACDKADKVDSPLVGTWFESDGEFDHFYTFGADGSYQRIEDYYMNGRATVAHEHIVGDGSYKIDGDIITATITSIRVYMDGAQQGDPFDDFWPEQEKMKFKVEGNKLTLIHDYDSEDAWTEVLGKYSKPDDPEPEETKEFNATGELRGVMFDVHNENQQAVITLHPKANTIDVKFVQARMTSEDETPQDIYIYNMPINAGEAHIKLKLEDGSYYTPFSESYAYAIMDQEQKTFNMHFGNDDEQDTQVYLVFNAMLQ